VKNTFDVFDSEYTRVDEHSFYLSSSSYAPPPHMPDNAADRFVVLKNDKKSNRTRGARLPSSLELLCPLASRALFLSTRYEGGGGGGGGDGVKKTFPETCTPTQETTTPASSSSSSVAYGMHPPNDMSGEEEEEPHKTHLKQAILRSIGKGACDGMCATDIVVAVQCSYLRSIQTSARRQEGMRPPPSQREVSDLLEDMVASKMLTRTGQEVVGSSSLEFCALQTPISSLDATTTTTRLEEVVFERVKALRPLTLDESSAGG
jgi:hypothetical protein